MAEGRTDFERDPNEWYVEPESSTDFLLDREVFEGTIWDPACGMGNIVKACIRRGHEAVGTDLVKRPCSEHEPWWRGPMDFTRARESDARLGGQSTFCPNVICNPPYGKAKLAELFIREAVLMHGVRKAAFFVNAKFLFGVGRARGLFSDLPPTRVYPVYPRPSCPPGDYLLAGNKAGGGVENFCWLVYDLGIAGGATALAWAPGQPRA